MALNAAIGGKARISGGIGNNPGTTPTRGVGGRSDAPMQTNDGGAALVRRTALFWGIAFGVLIVTHFGGAFEE